MTMAFRSVAPLALLALPLAGCGGGMTLASAQVESPIMNGQPSEFRRIELDCSKKRSAGSVGPQVGLSSASVEAGSVLGAFATDFIFNLVESGLEQAQARRNAAYAISGIAQMCNFSGIDPGSMASFEEVDLIIERAQGTLLTDPSQQIEPAFRLKGRLSFRPRVVGKDTFLELQLLPTELTYGRTAAQTRGKGAKRVIVLIGFSDNTALGADAATSNTPIASALRLDFGKLQDGRRYSDKMIKHLKTSALIPMPASSSPVVTALVVETEDEMLALKALSSAFKSNRDSLESLIAGGKDK